MIRLFADAIHYLFLPDSDSGENNPVQVYPDVALSNPGKGTSEALQLRIVRILWVTDDFTIGEFQLSSENACSQR